MESASRPWQQRHEDAASTASASAERTPRHHVNVYVCLYSFAEKRGALTLRASLQRRSGQDSARGLWRGMRNGTPSVLAATAFQAGPARSEERHVGPGSARPRPNSAERPARLLKRGILLLVLVHFRPPCRNEAKCKLTRPHSDWRLEAKSPVGRSPSRSLRRARAPRPFEGRARRAAGRRRAEEQGSRTQRIAARMRRRTRRRRRRPFGSYKMRPYASSSVTKKEKKDGKKKDPKKSQEKPPTAAFPFVRLLSRCALPCC